MYKIISLLLLLGLPGFCVDVAATETDRADHYLSLNIDRVVVDSDELSAASATLAGAVERLALAIERLSAEDSALSDADRQSLLSAVESTDKASLAIAELARQLPLSARQFGDRLPQAIAETRAALEKLSGGLQIVRESVHAIAESLPQATENSKLLVNSVLDSALLRLSIFSVVLMAAVALATIGIMWFVYRQYLDPLARKLDALVGVPEHFDNMARHMDNTSGNLLMLQSQAERGRKPFPGRRQNLQRRW